MVNRDPLITADMGVESLSSGKGITMVETLYRRKSPETAWHEECFELTMGEETVDDQLGYFVRETHCWWDAAGKCTVRVQYTLSPRGGFATAEEAQGRYELQRTTRAQRGFVHSFAPRYHVAGRCKYERIEIPVLENANEDQGPHEPIS